MNLFIVVVLVVYSLSSRADNYNEYSTFVADEDFEHQFFSDEFEDTNYTSEVEDLKKSNENSATTGDTTVDATKMSFPYYEIWEEEKDKRNGNVQTDGSKNFDLDFDHPGRHQISNLNREDEKSSEKLFLSHFPPVYQKVFKNYEESFHTKDREPNQPPMRREINAWRDEFSHSDNAPWSLDTFYPRHGSPNTPNEYFDDSSYAVDAVEQKNKSSSGLHLSLKDLLDQDDQPYYQKNYYYNYYPPPANGRKYNAPKWSPDEEQNSENIANASGRKPIRKNACRQYLQFLKYAFEKLDENPDYNYDYNEDDGEEWKNKENSRNPKVFAVHLLGPTLYVDNSGKVSQINAKGNSYQSVDRLPYVPKTAATLPKESNSKENSGTIPTRGSTLPTPKTPGIPFVRGDFRLQSTTLPPHVPIARTRTERLTTLPNENYYDQPKTTTEMPWLLFSLKTNLTGSNMTKEQKLNPEVQHRSSFGTRVEEEWRREDVFETTVRSKTEHTIFDEYDYGDTKPSFPAMNTYPPMWLPSEEYYKKLAKALGRKENDTRSNAISSETNAAVGPPVYFLGQASTPQPTTLSPIHTKLFRHDLTEIPTRLVDKKDDDCNDRMLPCPDTVNVTYPLNGYCNRYVSCESGRAIRKTCPDGLHFNIITKSCDLPHNSFCTYTCPAPNGNYGIPGDCNGYFVCKNDVPDYRMCPPRMHWDINKNACTFAELSSCPMKCSPKGNEVKNYEGDCKAYIICLNGIPYYHKCPPNTKFDKSAQSCVPNHQSKCEDDPRLLTKTSNPNHLCRNVEVKLGSKVWCNYFFPEESHIPRKQFEE